MDPSGNPRTEIDAQDQVDRGPRAEGSRSINRRDWLRLTVSGGAGPIDRDHVTDLVMEQARTLYRLWPEVWQTDSQF